MSRLLSATLTLFVLCAGCSRPEPTDPPQPTGRIDPAGPAATATLPPPRPEADRPAAHKTMQLGPFHPRPALAVYLVNDLGPTSVRLTLRRGPRTEGDRVMIRLFDPDEKLVHRSYSTPGRLRETLMPGDVEVYGIPIRVPEVSRPGDILTDLELPLPRNGIYQLRVSAGAHNSAVSLEMPEAMPYGVSFQNGTFSSWRDDLSTAYAWVPKRADRLTVSGGPVAVADQAGTELYRSDSKRGKQQTLAIATDEALWTLRFDKPADWSMQAWDMPLILCSTPEAARRIRAGVEVCADGTVVAHKFQKRIRDEVLPWLLDPSRVGHTDEMLGDLASVREALRADPARNSILVQPFDGLLRGINVLLRNQNLDPTSHWAGSLYGWQAFADKDAPENRWDRHRSIKGLWAGISPSSVSAGAEKLALLGTMDDPVNPWRDRRRQMIYRAAAAALADLQALGEDEVWRGVSAENPYPGFMAFALAQKTMPVFAVAGPHVPENVRQVWAEGLARIYDRGYTDGMVSARNQSSHYLVAWQAMADGLADDSGRLHELSVAYFKRWARGAREPGYFEESCGPDSSYIGMTNWHMAVAWRMRNDPVLLEAIRKCYRFFNHTCAPEPDGRAVGGFNFNHRVGAGFHAQQWQGANNILDDVLPEVGLWASDPRSPEAVAAGLREIDAAIAKPDTLSTAYHPARYAITWPRYKYFAKPDTSGTWPAREAKPFIRNIADELICVNRDAYYLAVFVGQPAPDPFYIRGRQRFRAPLPDDAENTGGGINVRAVTPFLGGGLTLLNSPGYGNSILGTCWSPLAQHGLVAVKADDTRWWADYYSTAWTLDEKAGTLTVTGRIEGHPLGYTRAYRFDKDQVRVSLTVKADKDVELKSFFENIPLLGGAVKAQGVTVAMEEGRTDRFSVRDKRGKGVDIVFDAPQSLTHQPNGLASGAMQIGRVEAALPSQMKAGQSVTINYRIVPVN